MSSQYFFTLNKKINKGQILYAVYNTLSLKESIERSQVFEINEVKRDLHNNNEIFLFKILVIFVFYL